MLFSLCSGTLASPAAVRSSLTALLSKTKSLHAVLRQVAGTVRDPSDQLWTAVGALRRDNRVTNVRGLSTPVKTFCNIIPRLGA
jgi:hypothetical protein